MKKIKAKDNVAAVVSVVELVELRFELRVKGGWARGRGRDCCGLLWDCAVGSAEFGSSAA